jgi:hypothetical protein
MHWDQPTTPLLPQVLLSAMYWPTSAVDEGSQFRVMAPAVVAGARLCSGGAGCVDGTGAGVGVEAEPVAVDASGVAVTAGVEGAAGAVAGSVGAAVGVVGAAGGAAGGGASVLPQAVTARAQAMAKVAMPQVRPMVDRRWVGWMRDSSGRIYKGLSLRRSDRTSARTRQPVDPVHRAKQVRVRL